MAGLLPLRGEAAETYIAACADQVDDLDAVADLLKDEAQDQDARDLESSENIALQLLALARWTQSSRHFALGWLALGNVCLRQGRNSEAVSYFEKAGEMFQDSGDEVGWARTRISYLWSASQIGRAEMALEQVGRAQEILQRYHEDRRAGDLEIAIALTLESIGRYPEALSAFERALEVYQPRDSKLAAHHRAVVLVNKAKVLAMLGDFPGAVACEQEAWSIFAEQREFLRVAWIANDLAADQAHLGQYSAALHLYYQALEYYQHHPTLRNWEALCKFNMADCLLHLNRVPEALHLAEQAISIYRTLDETSHFAWALVLLARAQAACGNIPGSLSSLTEAYERFESVGAVAHSGLVLLAQAESLLLMKEHEKALFTIEQAHAIFFHFGMKAWLTEANLLTARIHEASGNLAHAEMTALQAREEARSAELPWLEFGAEVLQGRLAQHQGNILQAEQHYRAALSLMEGLMTWLVRDQRSTFLTDKEPVFNALISLALQRHDTNSALDILERLRSQVLREYLTRSSEIRLRATDPDEARFLAELQQLRQELQGYIAQMAALEKRAQETPQLVYEGSYRGSSPIAEPLTPQQALIRHLHEQQRHCEQQINELLERAFLHRESARFALLPKPGANHPEHSAPRHALVERLSAGLPPEGTLLEYCFQGDDLLIFIVKAGQHHAKLERVSGVVPQLTQELLPVFRANIDMAGQLLLRQPGDPGLHAMLEATIQGWGRQLYDLVFQPVKKHLPHNGRLLIVPYGPLHLLPFHALYSEQGYLIEQHELSYLPAASMFLLQAASQGDERRKHPGSQNALVLGYAPSEKLKHILTEAREVAKLMGAQPFTEDQATIAQLQQNGGKKTILHLAAHGKNRADAPDFSYLQLADGRLSMVDVFNLELSAELVTLSGCETGLVVIGGGDELLGLGRGFLYAGARSLLISLWNVEDESTAELMACFYQGLLAGKSRAAALRDAQHALIASAHTGKHPTSWAHPYFWAPFRLLGEAGPIPLA
ncbi:MAG TPA: CHAT domain-containing protein [Ktedonobacterales bacterium]